MGDDNLELIICSECNTENSKENNFCLNCGKPLKKTEKSSVDRIICPSCGSTLDSRLKFCTDCGAKIEEPDNTIEEPGSTLEEPVTTLENCPVCYVKLEPELKYCRACGAEVAPAKAKKEEPEQNFGEKSKSDVNNIADSVLSTGKDIVKGIDGLIKDAASSLDNRDKSKIKEEEPTKPRIKPRFKKPHPGYLVCNRCSGYYELQPGESADDFIEECECGGKLEHQDTI